MRETHASGSTQAALDGMRGDAFVDASCAKCALSRTRKQVVAAEGGRRPLAFFVGEAPGPEEDREGRPFIGRAGKILRRSLAGAGWKPDEVWITNTVKCFPHESGPNGKARIRRPDAAEAAACRQHLLAEVKALRPRIIVALGQTAAQALLREPPKKLALVRASLQAARPDLGEVAVFVTYHPSGLHYGHATEAEFQRDLAQARRLCAQ